MQLTTEGINSVRTFMHIVQTVGAERETGIVQSGVNVYLLKNDLYTLTIVLHI